MPQDIIEMIDGQKCKYALLDDGSRVPYSVSQDAGVAWNTSYGITTGGYSNTRFTSSNISGTVNSVTDLPVSGQRLVVTDIIVSSDTSMRVDFQEETSQIVMLSVYIPAYGIVQITPRSKWKLPNPNRRLQVKSNSVGNIAITAFYYSET